MEIKVYEVMEKYQDYKFIIYSSVSDCLFKGYKAVCKSWALNMWVYDFAELSNKTVVIFLY